MTRVLYWNIEKFAFNKIANPSTAKHHGSVTEAEAARDRLSYIENVVAAVQPHVVVVVEISTAFVGDGMLASGSGLDGCFELLDEIRGWLGDDPHNPNWMLVPPIQTGPREAVAVFYDRRNRYFSGPNRWPGGANGVSARPPAATGNYPDALRTRLPDRTVPGNSLHNPNRSERRVAARTDFTRRAGVAHAGAAVDWNGRRAPYMVTFAETNADNSFKRNLTLFAIHSPSKIWLARPYLETTLPLVAEIVDGLNNREGRVVVGDFNVNLLKSADQTEADAYDPLQTAAHYRLLLKPLVAAPNPLNGYENYFATHIRGKDTAACWSSFFLTTYYPGYGYTGSDKVANTYAIDNAFVRYGANGSPPANSRFTVMNPIVGSPYDDHPAPDPATPIGTLGLDRLILLPPPAVPPATGPQSTIGLVSAFQGWDNYWYLRSTSDHLALAMDV